MRFWIFYLFFLTGFALLHAQNQKLKVVSSASIFDDMVKNIGGDKIEHASIVPIGGDPHIYEATPDDAKLIAAADLILVNGLTFEGWIQEIISNSGSTGEVITITQGITPIASKQHNNAVDPHAWMTASNGLIYIENIKNALLKHLPRDRNYILQNYDTYRKKLEALDVYIQSQIHTIPQSQRVLITSHDAFSYYGNRYGLKIEAIMGVSTEADVQTADMKRVLQTIKLQHIPAIFIESTINPKLLYQISKDTGVKIGGSLFADSIGDRDSSGNSYLDMLKSNTDVIVQALTGKNFALNGDQSSQIRPLMYILIILMMLLSWIFLFYNIRR